MTHAELTAIAYACSCLLILSAFWLVLWTARMFRRVVKPTASNYSGQRRAYKHLMAHPDELQNVKISRTGIYPVRQGSVVSGVVGGIIGYEIAEHHHGSSMDDDGEEDIPW